MANVKTFSVAQCVKKNGMLAAVQLVAAETDGSRNCFEPGHLVGLKQAEGVCVAEVKKVVGPRISLLFALTKGPKVVKHWQDPSPPRTFEICGCRPQQRQFSFNFRLHR